VADESEVQPAKAPSPMLVTLVTLYGMSTEARDVQP
jgi:hypothetical protein